MSHPVVLVAEEQAAAAIAGMEPDKEPYVIVCLRILLMMLDQLEFRVRSSPSGPWLIWSVMVPTYSWGGCVGALLAVGP
jgi:hypothetical protein